MKWFLPLGSLAVFLSVGCGSTAGWTESLPSEQSLQLRRFDVRYEARTDSVVFEAEAAADVASFVPPPAGQVDGAPVIGYAFLTDLQPEVVGFRGVEGTVALAVTSHPDFDDTPLWDEDQNAAYDDDGAVYHAHWVVLREDMRAPAGLAVAQAPDATLLPPTAPMPMYLDSPGFTVVEDGTTLRVMVPADRIGRQVQMQVQALTAYLKVDASGALPLLGVEEVLSSLDGAQSVRHAEEAPAGAWPTEGVEEIAQPDGLPTFTLESARVEHDPRSDAWIFSVEAQGAPALAFPRAAGQVDGAPVWGYVFTTSLSPEAVGFRGIDGTVALAVTSHPDFDDTPLWDENLDADYANDGATYHVHWVVLVEDADSPAGLSVPRQADAQQLPPTAPMPMYLDSPGLHAFVEGNFLRVIVPRWHLRGVTELTANALTAAMRVDAAGEGPILRVESVLHTLEETLRASLSEEE